jgi:hypothetical protein
MQGGARGKDHCSTVTIMILHDSNPPDHVVPGEWGAFGVGIKGTPLCALPPVNNRYQQLTGINTRFQGPVERPFTAEHPPRFLTFSDRNPKAPLLVPLWSTNHHVAIRATIIHG